MNARCSRRILSYMYTFSLMACSLCASLGVASLFAQACKPAEEEGGECLQTTQSLLKSSDPLHVNRAITSVVRLGPRAKLAIPILIEMLSDRRLIYENALVPSSPT